MKKTYLQTLFIYTFIPYIVGATVIPDDYNRQTPNEIIESCHTISLNSFQELEEALPHQDFSYIVNDINIYYRTAFYLSSKAQTRYLDNNSIREIQLLLDVFDKKHRAITNNLQELDQVSNRIIEISDCKIIALRNLNRVYHLLRSSY